MTKDGRWLNRTEILRDLYRQGIYNYKHHACSAFVMEDSAIRQALKDIDGTRLEPEKKECELPDELRFVEMSDIRLANRINQIIRFLKARQ